MSGIRGSIKPPDCRPVSVRVGLLDDRRYMTGESVIDVAIKNEYGADGVPARAFMRLTADRHIGEWKDVVQSALDAGKTIEQALETVGLTAVADMQETIERGVPPALSPLTIRAKKAKGLAAPEHTLVDTGLMQESIAYELTRDS